MGDTRVEAIYLAKARNPYGENTLSVTETTQTVISDEANLERRVIGGVGERVPVIDPLEEKESTLKDEIKSLREGVKLDTSEGREWYIEAFKEKDAAQALIGKLNEEFGMTSLFASSLLHHRDYRILELEAIMTMEGVNDAAKQQAANLLRLFHLEHLYALRQSKINTLCDTNFETTDDDITRAHQKFVAPINEAIQAVQRGQWLWKTNYCPDRLRPENTAAFESALGDAAHPLYREIFIITSEQCQNARYDYLRKQHEKKRNLSNLPALVCAEYHLISIALRQRYSHAQSYVWFWGLMNLIGPTFLEPMGNASKLGWLTGMLGAGFDKLFGTTKRWPFYNVASLLGILTGLVLGVLQGIPSLSLRIFRLCFEGAGWAHEALTKLTQTGRWYAAISIYVSFVTTPLHRAHTLMAFATNNHFLRRGAHYIDKLPALFGLESKPITLLHDMLATAVLFVLGLAAGCFEAVAFCIRQIYLDASAVTHWALNPAFTAILGEGPHPTGKFALSTLLLLSLGALSGIYVPLVPLAIAAAAVVQAAVAAIITPTAYTILWYTGIVKRVHEIDFDCLGVGKTMEGLTNAMSSAPTLTAQPDLQSIEHTPGKPTS